MNVLVTRPNPTANDLINRLKDIKINACSLPLIEFSDGKDLKKLPKYLIHLPPGNMVFLLSQRSVYFAQKVLKQNKIQWPQTLKYYAIGYSTANEFYKYSGLKIIYPNNQTSDGLINLSDLQNISGKIGLILTSNIGRTLLIKTLYQREVKVILCECYKNCEKSYDGVTEGKRLRAMKIKIIIVTSGNMLKQLFNLFSVKDKEEWLLKCCLVVVSERLASLAKNMGWNNIQVSLGADNISIVNALQKIKLNIINGRRERI